MEPGDEIMIETALGMHTYVVRRVFIVAPTAVEVTDPKRGAWLTLTTCNPKFSARERLIISAELVDGPNFAYALADKDFVPAGAS
jgi:sortase A